LNFDKKNSNRKKTIEFTLKDFSKIFNQNRESKYVNSPKYFFENYDWYISARTSQIKEKEFHFGIYLTCCKSTSKQVTPFKPVYSNIKFTIVNQRDLRENFSVKRNFKSNEIFSLFSFLNLNFKFYHFIIKAFNYYFEKETGKGYVSIMKIEVNFGIIFLTANFKMK
jgi:hypothetical protein